MSDSDDLKSFYAVADEFIQLANRLNQTNQTTRVSAAMLYAAARYNAFNFQVVDNNADTVEDAIQYYIEQYEEMLRENFASIVQKPS